LLQRIEGFDESRVADIVDDLESLMDMAPECTGYMVSMHLTFADSGIAQSIFAPVRGLYKQVNATDLYSLGCLMYRLLCGRPLFKAVQSIDLVYLHVSVRPKEPSARSRYIPQSISALVMRLLQKAAEDRYQTAHTVLTDIEELLGRWTAGLKLDILPFNPVKSGRGAQIVLPTFMFGRIHELGVLRETCEATSRKGWWFACCDVKRSEWIGEDKAIIRG
jgi:serine/threonine protein kinase